MKKFWIFIITIIPLLGFTSCDDRDEIRDEIDALSARLDKLQPEIDKLNDNISTFYDLVNGKILFTDYSYNEENGDYTLRLSNGKTWTVYSGKPENGVPVVTIKDGRWVFEYNGETKDLGAAVPEDGKDGVTPVMSINDEGYWCYSINGSDPVPVDGPYNVAEVGSIKPSIFEDVKTKDDNNKILCFKLYDDDVYTEIPVLGGLDMTFPKEPVSVKQGGKTTITATLTYVENVVINPTPLQVELTDAVDNNLSISAPAGLETGDYKIYFEIYSKEGYRLVKELDVKVTSND